MTYFLESLVMYKNTRNESIILPLYSLTPSLPTPNLISQNWFAYFRQIVSPIAYSFYAIILKCLLTYESDLKILNSPK